MENNEKIIDIMKDYSNDYNLDKKLENIVLKNNSNILKVKYQIENGYKNPIKINIEVCIIEKQDNITVAIRYEAIGIKVEVETTHFKNHEGFESYGSISKATVTNQKGEKIKIFIDYKKNICGYTSNVKHKEAKQYYIPNRGCSLIFHIYERYCRVNSPSYIFNSNYVSLENEIEKVEDNFNNDIATFWEDSDAKSEDEMIYLQSKSSGRKFEPDIPTEWKFIDYNMPKLKY